MLKWSWLGGVCFGLNVALYFTSVRMTSIANVAIIGSLTPVIVFPIAVKWMGERVTRKAIVCSALAIAGVVVVVLAGGSSGQRALSGDLLAVVNLVSWAAFFLVTKHARKGVGTLEYLAAMTLVAAITVTPIAFLTGQDFGSVEGLGWLWLVLLVLIPGAAGHGLMTWAHADVDVSTSSVLVLGEPVLATIAAAVFLSESVNASADARDGGSRRRPRRAGGRRVRHRRTRTGRRRYLTVSPSRQLPRRARSARAVKSGRTPRPAAPSGR